MSPVEEFILNSDKLKQAILEEALRENAKLRELVDEQASIIHQLKDSVLLMQSKMNTLERVNARLSASLDDMK